MKYSEIFLTIILILKSLLIKKIFHWSKFFIKRTSIWNFLTVRCRKAMHVFSERHRRRASRQCLSAQRRAFAESRWRHMHPMWCRTRARIRDDVMNDKCRGRRFGLRQSSFYFRLFNDQFLKCSNSFLSKSLLFTTLFVISLCYTFSFADIFNLVLGLSIKLFFNPFLGIVWMCYLKQVVNSNSI